MNYVMIRNLLILLLVLTPSISSANVLSTAVGIVTDPFGFGRGSSEIRKAAEIIRNTVDRAAIHAERLQGEVDNDVRDYIDEISDLIYENRVWVGEFVPETIDNVEKTVNNTLNQIRILESQFFSNVNQIVKCSSEISADRISRLLADSLNDLGSRRPRFEFFGIVLGEVKIDSTDIASPIAAFRETQRLYDAHLAQLSGAEPRSEITDTYAEIQRLSELTRCHYNENTTLYQELYMIELEYNRRGKYWRSWVSP